jgi:hypothetical protein
LMCCFRFPNQAHENYLSNALYFSHFAKFEF